VPGQGDTTNDRGEFRVFGLPPGDYYVRASLSAPFGVAGGVYTPTFYPGTPLLAEAQVLTVEPGVERADLVFALTRAQAVSVSGVVRSRDGSPSPLVLVTLVEASGAAIFTDGGTAMSMMRPDGTFTLVNVLPGTYHLEARPVTTPGLQSRRLDLVVGSRDISGLVIEVGRGSVARGRIRFDAPRPPDGLSPEDVRIFPVALDDQHFSGGSMPNPPREDWTFELTGMSGRRVIRGGGLRGEWQVKSVHVHGVDVTDTPIDFSTDVDGIEVLFTREQTDLSGLVRADRGTTVTGATVLVFSDDAAKWGPQTRFVRAAQPDQHGRYQIRGLPAGDYVAVALEDLEPGEEGDPELLQQLRTRGERVRLTDGQRRTLNLTVVGH
jgi:hypothetical protein